MISIASTITAYLVDNANLLGQMMGKGPKSYTVKLTDNEDATEPTHYGFRGDESQDWIDLLLDAKQGNWRSDIDWDAAPLTQAQAQEVVDAMVIDLWPDVSAEEPVSYPNARAHFLAAIERHGLQMFTNSQAQAA